jgi:hypothetical protein
MKPALIKPTATLTVTTRPSGALLYEARDTAGAVVWASLGYASESGRERVRERLRAWLVEHPYTVVLAKEEERRRAS